MVLLLALLAMHDLPMHDWITALEMIKIAIIQLVNTIEPPFTIILGTQAIHKIYDTLGKLASETS